VDALATRTAHDDECAAVDAHTWSRASLVTPHMDAATETSAHVDASAPGAHVDAGIAATLRVDAYATVGAHVDARAAAVDPEVGVLITRGSGREVEVDLAAAVHADASPTVGAHVDSRAAAVDLEVDVLMTCGSGREVESDSAAAVHADTSPPSGAHVDARSAVDARVDASPAHGAHHSSTRLAMAVLRTQAKDALTRLGWKPTIAQAAVTTASATLGVDVTIERLIFEALRRV
jgi:hypothetical protein